MSLLVGLAVGLFVPQPLDLQGVRSARLEKGTVISQRELDARTLEAERAAQLAREFLRGPDAKRYWLRRVGAATLAASLVAVVAAFVVGAFNKRFRSWTLAAPSAMLSIVAAFTL